MMGDMRQDQSTQGQNVHQQTRKILRHGCCCCAVMKLETKWCEEIEELRNAEERVRMNDKKDDREG